ncbi:hypothetical protein D9M69_570280 [compost metagenome]
MPLTRLWVTQHQRIAQQLFQRDAFVGQDGMTLRYSYHQWIAPSRSGDDAVADLIRLGEPYVIQIVMQSLDLLR